MVFLALIVSALLAVDGGQPVAPEIPPKEAARYPQEVTSAFMCGDAFVKGEAKKAIEEERTAAREGGGVVDVEVIYQQQQIMRLAAKHASDMQKTLTGIKASALKCSDKHVAEIVHCIGWRSMGGMYGNPIEWVATVPQTPECANWRIWTLSTVQYTPD